MGQSAERDPERVKRDVRDEYVTMEWAKENYGVVVIGDPLTDPEGLQVDYEATYALRAELRRQREVVQETALRKQGNWTRLQ